MYTAYAFGVQSVELAEALWRDREFEPLEKFIENEAGKRSRQAYVSCLLRWGYIKWNPKPSKGQRQYKWTSKTKHLTSPTKPAEVNKLLRRE